MEDRIVKITVAGKVKEYEDGLNVTQLIEKENVETPEYVTVSVNDEFIEKADFDKTFTAAKNNFFMVAENYPALRSSENFMQLQKTLNETEEQLSASRRTYNAAVTDYNNSVMTFPSNIIANLFSFTKKEVFAIPEEEKVNPDVKKLFRS